MQTDHQVSIKGTSWLAPKAVTECTVCYDDVSSVAVCEGGHKICKACFENHFDRLNDCPECRTKLTDRGTARFTVKAGLLTLNNTNFRCLSKQCKWSGGYNDLDDHRLSCSDEPVNCDYDCGETLPRRELTPHKQQCRKRPYRE
ncbi:RING finger protein, partial [Sansalvadorimonas verongulae]|uniref:RING finger protein n=1 Tax=Sansalvadorimonas verongulae TaxID=2172824 RepID=UPI0038B66E82